MSEVEFRLTADTASARQEVSRFRKEYADMVQAVERPLRKIDALKGTQESAKAAAAEFYAAKRQVDGLKSAMAQAGQPVKELDRELVKAERTLAKTTFEFERQKKSLRDQRAELRQAGVDTKNLATEQARLQQELSQSMSGGRNDAAISGIRARTAELKKQAVAQRQANIEQARQDLGINRQRQLQAETSKLRQQYELLRTSGKLSASELETAHKQLNQRIKENERAMRDLNRAQGADDGGQGLSGIGGKTKIATGVAAAAVAAGAYSAALDPLKKMGAQLKLATASHTEFNIAQAETYRIAQLNQAPLEEVVGLYARLAPAMREMGRGQDDTLKMIDAVTKSFRISGATASETAAAITQFAQALGSGVLRGDEFNSIAEQAPRLMQALADSLKVNVGALRQMAADGQLTADVIADALIGQLPKLSAEAEQLPETWSGAMTVVKNELLLAAKSLDDFTGGSSKVIGVLSGLGEAIQKIRSGEFADFFKDSKQSAEGLNNEAGVLLARIRDLNNARGRLDRTDPNDSVLFGFKFWTKADFDRKLKELQEQVQDIYEQRDKLENALKPTEQEVQHAKALGEYTQYVSALKGIRDKAVEDAKKQAKDLLSVEKTLTKDLENARKARQALEARFANLRTPVGEAQPNYLNVLELQQRAALALKNGDSLTAKKSAEDALAMLEKLRDSGENMYGYDSLITSLEGVALAVNDIETQALEDKLTGVKVSISLLEEEAKKLQDMPISVKADEASIDVARTAIESLIAKLKAQEVVIPVRVAMPSGVPVADDSLPAYASGGRIRGPGTGTSDSILARLSNGEFVVRAAAVRHYGPDLLERLNSMRLPRYATGGHVGPLFAPHIPEPSQAVLNAGSPAAMPHLGSLDLNLGGQSYTVYVENPVADQLGRAARKFGRTHR